MLDALRNDSNIWLAFSFILFVYALYKLAWPLIIASLDARIETIKSDIKTAENLRVEAQELLAQYQRKHRDSVEQANKIRREAEEHAAKIREHAETELDHMIERREKQLKMRLARIEAEATAQIQGYAADLAVQATREIIKENMDKKRTEAIASQSIDGLQDNLCKRTA